MMFSVGVHPDFPSHFLEIIGDSGDKSREIRIEEISTYCRYKDIKTPHIVFFKEKMTIIQKELNGI